MGCQIILLEVGNTLPHVPDPPVPFPEVQSGPSGIAVATRCPDDGDVDLEVWASDPGPPAAGWKIVFDGSLEISARGLDAGPATATAFYIEASPGKYHVRAEARRDRSGLVDGVRFIFPENGDLQGKALY